MKEGDRVRLTLKDKVLEGVVMPSTKKSTVVLKLDSGYNVGVAKKSVKSSKVLKQLKKKRSAAKKHVHDKKKKTVTILHTGGTIASKVDYETGAVSAKFSPEELVALFPDLGKEVNVRSRLISNMFSEDMRFSHYNSMAKEIQKEVKAGVDGIIVTHGTDTLHYTSAALAFILEDLPIPVVLFGAQRSSDRGSSDAAMNLMAAVLFIKEAGCADVAVCMHKGSSDTVSVILPGLKCRKMHSSRRDAFHPVNAEPWAEVDVVKKKVKTFGGYKKEGGNLTLRLFKDVKVGLLKAHPHMAVEEFKAYSKFDGLVLEGTGLGHFPVNVIDAKTKEHDKVLKTLTRLAKKMPVVMSTQTVFGRVNLQVYSTGRVLEKAGVLGHLSDMSPETSYIKLAWLLSNHPKHVAKMYGENLRGELNPRISEAFL